MKRVKCLNCHDERDVPDDTVMAICEACQEEMVEKEEINNEVKEDGE